jgi:hypothetical protein
MSKQSFEIWGRKLDLEIAYDCYKGEEVLSSQENALKLFCENAVSIFETAKEKAEEYCFQNNREDIGAGHIENIFKYVMPKTIYIKRTFNNERTVAILCAYKFNLDDGLAIVFTNEKFSKIGTENIIL